MGDDTFEMPDMSDLLGQMQEAMSEAQDAMDDLPEQMGDLQDVMGSLSSVMEGMPQQMGDLGSAMAGFSEQHEANAATLAGEPDWTLEADIRVGSKLHAIVSAAFDLEMVTQAFASTQGGGFESLVAGVVESTGEETDPETMQQIVEQLSKGRSVATVQGIRVLECAIAGAPADAAAKLQLSPQGNIPLVMDESGLGFELAPVLTIRNQWENAELPTFVPMADELRVGLDAFESGESFSARFEVEGQDDPLTVEFSFKPIA